MRFVEYITVTSLLSMGLGMGLFVLVPSVVKYHRFKDAPKAQVTELIYLERPYKSEVVAKYAYEFKGETYTSDQFASFPTFTQYDERVRDVENRSQAKTGFYCYVNTADSSEAVLINDFEHFTFWMLTLGFVLFPLGMGISIILHQLGRKGEQVGDGNAEEAV